MKKFEGYLLASDIDGTIADHAYIPPANIAAIKRFIDDGGRVVLATGRSPQSAVPVANALGCEATIIANNGALVYSCERQEAVLQYELECLDTVFDIVNRFPEAGALLYCGSKLQLLASNIQMEELIKSEQLTVQTECGGTVNKVLFSGNAALLDRIEQYSATIKNLNGDVVRSDDVYIEILPKGVDKGRAMVALAQDMGYDIDHVFAAGNFYNDITMLQFAALSCAPIESPEAVKAEADYIACTCREGAVAQFIEHLYTRF